MLALVYTPYAIIRIMQTDILQPEDKSLDTVIRGIAGQGATHQKRNTLLIAVLFLVLGGMHLFSLLHVPLPFVDEAWFANRAWALMHTGRAFGTLDAGTTLCK